VLAPTVERCVHARILEPLLGVMLASAWHWCSSNCGGSFSSSTVPILADARKPRKMQCTGHFVARQVCHQEIEQPGHGHNHCSMG